MKVKRTFHPFFSSLTQVSINNKGWNNTVSSPISLPLKYAPFNASDDSEVYSLKF